MSSLDRLTVALAATLVAATLLAGCVQPLGKSVYVKPGASEDAKKRDKTVCVQASHDTAGPRAAAPLAVDRDAGDRCMRGRGYRVETS
jgi:hypothetical protein